MSPRRVPLAVLAALTLGGCGPKSPASVAELLEKLDFGMTPRLPSPEAGTYAAGPETPRDPLVGALMKDRHHDGGLAAASAGLVLAAVEGKGGITRWELREALWRAGYPYPVIDARAWTVAVGAAPPRDLATWLESVPREQPVGMARGRARDQDVWVGMRASPPVDLGALPRVAALGTPLHLPAVPGATWQVADNVGAVRGGTLDQGASILLAAAGEWLVEVRQDGRELARFPVYVGIGSPRGPLLRLSRTTPPVADAEDAEDLAVDLLAHIRDTYGALPWRRSPVFDAAVRRYVEDPALGSAGVLSGIGYAGVDAIVWACDDVTVENCLDTWVWDLRRRRTLLTDQMDSYGLHVTLDSAGVHLTLLLVDAD